MTARQAQNPRWGNIAEVAAQSYLMPFAFVCPVPRPEDVGSDFLCTLSERLNGSAYARQSFLVQSKSASVDKLVLDTDKGHLDWLARLELPLFFVSIDLANATAELFWTSHVIHEIWIESRRDHPARTVTIHFGDRTAENDPEGLAPTAYSSRHKGGHFHVWLGQPLLSWNANELKEDKLYQTAFGVISRALVHHKEACDDYPLGIFSTFGWATGSPPTKAERDYIDPPFRQDAARRAFENGYRVLEVLARDLVESPTNLLPQNYSRRRRVVNALFDWARELAAELPTEAKQQALLSNNPAYVKIKRDERIKQAQVWAIQIKGWIDEDKERFKDAPDQLDFFNGSRQADLDNLLNELKMHGQQYVDQVLNDSALREEVVSLSGQTKAV